jgi:peptidyl-prolyl cis-trans isomerase SurA
LKSKMKFWRKSAKPIAVVLGLGLILTVVPPVWAKVVDRVVATVNGVIITLSTVQERAAILQQQMQASGETPEMGEKEFILKTLDSIIEEKLQLQEAKRAGLDVNDAAVQAALEDIVGKNNITMEQMEGMLLQEGRSMKQYKKHIRDQIMTSKVMQFHMGKQGQVSDKQIKKYYFEHQKDFWQSKKPFVRHILFIVEEDSLEELKASKREQAENVLAEIQAGEDFIELAKKHSEDVSASSGGEVGWLAKGHLVPEFEEVAFKLKSGEVSDIVESRYGFHIIKVEKVSSGKSEPLESVKGKIKQILSFEGRQKKYKEWMDGLKKDSMIQITLFENEDTKEDSFANSLQPADIREAHWEEASSVKNKLTVKDPGLNRKNFQVMERKLAYIKKLRRYKKITEKEYLVRKQRLLDQL